ncbi:MAG: alpha/beta hydrolase [Chloroflexota bacterium]
MTVKPPTPEATVKKSEPISTPEPAATTKPAYTPIFLEAECRFKFRSSAEVRCGDLIVPENRAYPVHGITIHVAIISSYSDQPEPDPLVYLTGGPGEPTLDFTDQHIISFNEVLKQRDLILFDQRGVGHSSPSLDCHEIAETERTHREIIYADFSTSNELFLDAWQTCRDRLVSEGVDLSAYNSAAVTADLEDLFSLLEYDMWNLYGTSYGGRLALTAMREDTQGIIRSVILDSPLPPHIDTLSELGPNTAGIFELLFERCAAFENCADTYPSLPEDFYALVDKLNDDPISLVVNDYNHQETFLRPLNGYELIDVLFYMMYSPYEIKYVPQIVDHLDDGRTQRISRMLSQLLAHQATSEGMAMSVLCTEEFPFVDEQHLANQLDGLPDSIKTYAKTSIEFNQNACDIWAIDPQPVIEMEPVKSDIPTLILAGDYDPITPPHYAQSAASYLGQTHYIEFEGLSHGIIWTSRCSKELISLFLNDPLAYPESDCKDPGNLGFATQ